MHKIKFIPKLSILNVNLNYRYLYTTFHLTISHQKHDYTNMSKIVSNCAKEQTHNRKKKQNLLSRVVANILS